MRRTLFWKQELAHRSGARKARGRFPRHGVPFAIYTGSVEPPFRILRSVQIIERPVSMAKLPLTKAPDRERAASTVCWQSRAQWGGSAIL